PRGAWAHRAADRRRCRGERFRSPRVDAAAGIARGGVHGSHQGGHRVQGSRARARGGCGVSTLAGIQRLPRATHTGRVTQTRVVRSEWTKLYSLRSTRWSLFAGILLTIAFPVIFAAATSSHWGSMSAHERADRQPLDIALAGVNVSQLAVAVLGVLVITGEYSTGMIRASFSAVPKRLPVLWAKTAVFGVVTLLLMVPSVVIAFVASQAILSRHHILQISFSHPGVARAVLGGAAYVVLVGIFALGIGAMLRNTAGGIATFAGIFFVLPPLMNVLPAS